MVDSVIVMPARLTPERLRASIACTYDHNDRVYVYNDVVQAVTKRRGSTVILWWPDLPGYRYIDEELCRIFVVHAFAKSLTPADIICDIAACSRYSVRIWKSSKRPSLFHRMSDWAGSNYWMRDIDPVEYVDAFLDDEGRKYVYIESDDDYRRLALSALRAHNCISVLAHKNWIGWRDNNGVVASVVTDDEATYADVKAKYSELNKWRLADCDWAFE